MNIFGEFAVGQPPVVLQLRQDGSIDAIDLQRQILPG